MSFGAKLCQVTLRGDIDYGLLAYQLCLNASYQGLFQADLWLMARCHDPTLLLLAHRETHLWTIASSERTEHERYQQFEDLPNYLLQTHTSYRCRGAVIIDTDF